MRRVLFAALLFVGCGGGDKLPTAPIATPTPPPSRSIIAVTSNPNPVVAGPGGTGSTTGQSFPFSARFSLVVGETAGLACNINRISILFPGTNNTIPYNPADVQRLAGTNFIAARSELTIPMSIVYGPNRQQTLLVTVEAIDANGNTVTAFVNVMLV